MSRGRIRSGWTGAFIGIALSFRSEAQTFTVYQVDPYATPMAVAAGQVDEIWVGISDRLLRVGCDGVVREVVSTIEGAYLASQLDGGVWFSGASGVGWRMGSGETHIFPMYGYDLAPPGDGTLWFIKQGPTIAHTDSTGTILANFPPTASPDHLTWAPGGTVWMTGYSDRIVRMMPTGEFTTFHTAEDTSSPRGIVCGPDGNLWFTEPYVEGPDITPSRTRGRIGRITPQGIITEFPIGSQRNGPTEICVGPDGNLWFSEFWGRVGRITTRGQITEWDLPSGVFAGRLTFGPDGALWICGGPWTPTLTKMTIPAAPAAAEVIPILPAWAAVSLAVALAVLGAALVRRMVS